MSEDRSTPFDAVADNYDAKFSDAALGVLLRTRIWRVLHQSMPDSGALLELGCGTGEDALHMASRGAHVTATDVSEKMCALTATKTASLQVNTALLNLNTPADSVVQGPFDGAWSSLGPLNCVADRQPFWRWLTEHLQPDAPVVLIIMNKWTPWDWFWFGIHGQWQAATRRFRSGQLAHAGAGSTISVWYPGWRTVAAECSEHFVCERVEGLGVLLPISEAAHLVDRWPKVFEVLGQLERFVCRLPLFRSLSDHYIIQLRRRSR
ncbi:MAG TPA: hypothetical protein DCQ06_12865 [Myxococcales bacterium]|nr:hypothetical protein [Myxococcales bacterium]HAN32480.1 hypothetical protein [Myxococcales bacterium]